MRDIAEVPTGDVVQLGGTILSGANPVGRPSERAFNHPAMGVLHYQQVSLSLAGWPDYRLTMLLPAQPIRS